MKISITKGEAEKLLAIFEEPAANLTWPTDYRLHGADARALAALARLGASVAFESEDTVEKVAEKIEDASEAHGRWQFREHARAAIAALREGL